MALLFFQFSHVIGRTPLYGLLESLASSINAEEARDFSQFARRILYHIFVAQQQESGIVPARH